MNRTKAALAAATAALALAATAARASETIAYSYDGRGRLTKVARSVTNKETVSSVYSYDDADNRTKKWTGTGIPPATLSLAIGSAGVSEGGLLSFTVTKTGSTTQSLSVVYETSGSTATSGTDFTAASGTLTFAPAETSKIVTVASIEDSVVEQDETFLVKLSGATGGATLSNAQGTGTIRNDDMASSNQPPATVNDSYTMTRCTSGANINVTANDTDPEGHSLTLSEISLAGIGNASIVSASSVRYVPEGSTGVEVLTYTVQDSLGAVATGKLNITITNGDCGPEV